MSVKRKDLIKLLSDSIAKIPSENLCDCESILDGAEVGDLLEPEDL